MWSSLRYTLGRHPRDWRVLAEVFQPDDNTTEGPDPLDDTAETAQVIRGFALATLELIAVAARDKELRLELRQRIQDVVDRYVDVAKTSQQAHDELTPEQVGTLLTALDQGSGLLLLGSSDALDDELLSTGTQRLLSPTLDTGVDQSPQAQKRLIQALRHRA